MTAGSPVPHEVLDIAECTAVIYEVVENILDIPKDAEGIWLCVQWEVIPDDRDLIWAPLNTMYEDIMDFLRVFLKKFRKKSLYSRLSQPWYTFMTARDAKLLMRVEWSFVAQ